MEAPFTLSRRFHYLPNEADAGLSPLFTLYTPDGAELLSETATNDIVGQPYIYRTSAVTFPQLGVYSFTWLLGDDVVLTGQVSVEAEPTGDVGASTPRTYHYQAPNFETGVEDLILCCYDTDGELVFRVLAPELATLPGVYATGVRTIPTQGHYLFVWSSESQGFAWTRIWEVLALTNPGIRTVTVYVIDTQAVEADPLDGVDVLISSTIGEPVVQKRTSDAGKAIFRLEDGSYIASIRKTGVLFNVNNLTLTVQAPVETNDNELYFFVDTPFAATFDTAALVTPETKSLMTVDLIDIEGNPLVEARILLTNEFTPYTVGGIGGTLGVMGTNRVLETDYNGHAEIYLLRGAKLVATFEGTSIRRTFTVPDEVSFALLDVLTEDEDPFDIIVPNIATAVRRSL